MGFFDFMKTKERVVGHCLLCGADIVEETNLAGDTVIMKAEFSLSDGNYVCPICRSVKSLQKKELKNMSKDDLVAKIVDNGFLSPNDFFPSKRIIKRSASFGDACTCKMQDFYFEIDETRQLLNFSSNDSKSIHPVSDLLDFELLDSGQKIADGNSLLGAVVGGITFGGAGAIVGSGLRSKKISDECISLSIKVVFNDMERNTEYINFVGSSAPITRLKRDSAAYDSLSSIVQECLSILTILLKGNHSQNIVSLDAKPSDDNIIDTIKKLGELNKQGILSDDEFRLKKTELLSRL